MTAKHTRRSSSNSIRNLRAIFERDSSTSPTSESGIAQSDIDKVCGKAHSDRKVTANLIDLERSGPQKMATREMEDQMQEEGNPVGDAPHSDLQSTVDHASTSDSVVETGGNSEKMTDADKTTESHSVQTPQEFVLPPMNTQSEHTEKTVSALEDEEAQMQTGDMTTAPIDNQEDPNPSNGTDQMPTVQPNGVTEQPEPTNSESEPTNAANKPQMPDISSKTPQRVSQPASASKASFRPAPTRSSIGKAPPAATVSSEKKPITARTSDASRKISTGAARPIQQPKPTSSSTPKAGSSSKPPANPTSNNTVPSIATSAKREPISLRTRTEPVKSRKPISSTSHLLMATAASSGRQEQAHPSASSSGPPTKATTPSVLERLTAPVVKRDRSSLASSTNGTACKALPSSSTRNSLQPDSIRKTSESSNIASRSASSTSRSAAVGGSSFLERMTRPTAASSGRAQTEKSAARTSSSQPMTNGSNTGSRTASGTSVRTKPAAAAGSLRRTAALGAAQQKSNGGARSASAAKPDTQTVAAAESPSSEATQEKSIPQANGIDVDGGVDGNGDGEKQVEDPLPRTSTPAVGGFEERMMETPDLRAGVIR